MLVEYKIADPKYMMLLQQGVVQQGLFQLHDLERNKDWDDYPYFEKLDDITYRGSYGVCDDLENLLKVYPELEADGRKFVVTMCKIDRGEEPDSGGWRWHKWGDYIGTQTPTREYLSDEPLIERVYCYHIYEKIA